MHFYAFNQQMLLHKKSGHHQTTEDDQLKDCLETSPVVQEFELTTRTLFYCPVGKLHVPLCTLWMANVLFCQTDLSLHTPTL